MRYLIIKPNCRELANHLWNYLSIYAYGLEAHSRVENPSFIDWHRHFNLKTQESFLTRVIAPLPFLHALWKTICILYGSYLIRARARCVLLTLGITLYLPPTKVLTTPENNCKTNYFIGWHFRNPIGLERYRDALIAAFMPNEGVLKEIEGVLVPFREKRLIGVHLRQQPYKGFEDGDFLVSPPRVRRIVDEYLREQKLDAENVALIIVSDKNIDPVAFANFTTHMRRGNDVAGLFLLSKCSVVIGTNSTFANLAAWFGNVPHIVTTNEPVDWRYYKKPTAYFENKYATFAQ